MSKQKTTIYDISQKAGVSIATVSRVLNHSTAVRKETKDRVLSVMAELGYTPNVFARGLGKNSMQTIGLLCADSSDLYLAKAIYYLERGLREHGYDSILCCTGFDLKAKQNAVSLLLSKKVDAMIMIGSNFVYETDHENRYLCEAAGEVPIMLLNATMDQNNIYSILTDDFSSMYDATTYFLKQNRQCILYFYNALSLSGKRKLSGFFTAMEDYKKDFCKDLARFYSGSHEDIHGMSEYLKDLYQNDLKFDAVLAADDYLAISAVKFANECGLSIPNDLSIIGYNNSVLTGCCTPELSSVDNRQELLCGHLILALMERLSGKEIPKKSAFSGILVHRGTTY